MDMSDTFDTSTHEQIKAFSDAIQNACTEHGISANHAFVILSFYAQEMMAQIQRQAEIRRAQRGTQELLDKMITDKIIDPRNTQND